ncbi:MAG TPA: PTS glucose transporter subunit IIA [Clostridia bacterium]|nr:PTS glucose transporter subunit IIA [Clostridia bacterium]
MFDFFKKKDDTIILYRPLKGKVIDITDVKDDMFSTRMMGDGVAVEPESETILSPCDGKILLIPKTLHAVALETKGGAEVLIHIGIDTVELKGQGFTCHVNAGDMVKRGDRLISIDRDYIMREGKPLTTPIVITNGDEKGIGIKKNLGNDTDIIMELVIKG